jgi:hypothetical protein
LQKFPLVTILLVGVLMYCPECGAEYREGFFECSDCQVALVSQPLEELAPDQPIEPLELVTLLEIENPIRLALVRSVLEAEGIPSIVQGESPHALGGIAFISRRKKSVLQVAREDADRAIELVEALELPEDEDSRAE